MTFPTWPDSLPLRPLADRYQETLAETSIRTAMEQGPAKIRQRTTAGVTQIEASYVLSHAQAAVLETFYRVTLSGGTGVFACLHPRHGGAVTARFRRSPVLSARNGSYVLARTEIEILP